MNILKQLNNIPGVIKGKNARRAKDYFYRQVGGASSELQSFFQAKSDSKSVSEQKIYSFKRDKFANYSLELKKNVLHILLFIIDDKQDIKYIKRNLLDENDNFLNGEEGKLEELNLTLLSSSQRLLLTLYLYCYLSFSDKLESTKLSKFEETLNISKEFGDLFLHSYKQINLEENLVNQEPIELLTEPPQKVIEWAFDTVFRACKDGRFVKRQEISNLEAKKYEHHLDRQALEALKDTPGLEKLMKNFHKYGVDKVLKVRFTGSNIKVNKNNFPRLNSIFENTCQRVNLEKIPDLYIQQDLNINAFTTGVERPIVVINSGCLEMLSYEELLFIIGHEIGHIKSEHVLYHQMANVLPILGDVIGSATLGLGGLLSTSLQVALLNWQRKSEFTADRAGVLNCQDIDAAITAMMKLAGMPPRYYDKLNPKDFIEQAEEFEGFDENNLDKIAKKLSVMFANHPWTVMRAAEIKKWFESDGYRNILEDRKNFCTQCGNQLKENANFCTNCGAKV